MSLQEDAHTAALLEIAGMRDELERVRKERDQTRFDLNEANDEVERLGSVLAVAESERDELRKALEEVKAESESRWNDIVSQTSEAMTRDHEVRTLRDALKKALDAVWAYEESVQRDIKARGEVSDGTMHLQLLATDLRNAALSAAPVLVPKGESCCTNPDHRPHKYWRWDKCDEPSMATAPGPVDAPCPKCDGYRKALRAITSMACMEHDDDEHTDDCGVTVARVALSPRGGG